MTVYCVKGQYGPIYESSSPVFVHSQLVVAEDIEQVLDQTVTMQRLTVDHAGKQTLAVL